MSLILHPVSVLSDIPGKDDYLIGNPPFMNSKNMTL